MRTYIMTTGGIFGLLTIAHVWRYTVERDLLASPWHLSLTVITAVLFIWAMRLLRTHSSS